MKTRIDRESPIPIYFQLAEALRHRIATGDLVEGDRLPSIREAAAELGLNLHTVRKAYAELTRDGLVRVTVGDGTVVLRRTALVPDADAGLPAFLDRVRDTALRDFGLGRSQLAQAILTGDATQSRWQRPRVHFIECSELQCAAHCAELQNTWAIDARPFVLGTSDSLPDGILLATFFHYNDIRQLWPKDLERVRFVAINVDPALPQRVAAASSKRQTTLIVCELDEAKARNVAADISAILPESAFRVEPRVVAEPNELTSDVPPSHRVLLAPRLWACLTPEERREPRVFEVSYMIPYRELAALGTEFGWTAAANRKEA